MVYRIGQQLGNYRLVRHLGQGAFADVYLGEHRYLKSHAALKVLRVSLSNEDMQRFLSEAQTLVRLRHPHIVRVLEYAVDHGTPVLMMDYAPGGTIRQRHPRGSYLSLETTVAYVKQVAAALQYAHNHYLIHRDVKPENILLGPDQSILLSDFGLALFTPSAEQMSRQEMAGTIPYMAPEQIQGKPSFASDQYALGVVIYEWLCGKRPFEGTRWEITYQHLTVAPPPLREQFPELPVAVEQVVLRALAKDPQERFVSIQAFALALEHASQESHSDGEVDSQITAPLRAIGRPPSPSFPDQILSDTRTLRQIFLSASSADSTFATRLKADLNTRGISLSNERLGNTPNTLDQEDAIRHAIRAAHIVLIVLSSHTQTSRTIKEHIRIANMYGRRIVFVWTEDGEVAELLPISDTWGKTAVIDVFDAHEASYDLALRKIIACLEEDSEGSTLSVPAQIAAQGEPRNPYKGLRAFTMDEATDFFGRTMLIEELLGSLRTILARERPRMPGTRLLTVIGPSGSGKSSVVMAGLLPRLQEGALTESKPWLYLNPIVPGGRPFESLALTLAPHMPEKSVSSIREDLEDDSARGLHLLAIQLVKHSIAKVLLVIDQFEELFAQNLPEKERQRFIELLLTAVTEPDGHIVAVLTMRADFYDRPMGYPELSRLIEAHHVSVLPMELHDLHAVIEEPALQPDVQLTFEGNLIGDLLFETQGQAGALPLLEFTLDQLFQHREGHWLTQQAYQDIGGVKGALAKHAESTYTSLPSEDHRKLARVSFLRLIDPGMTEQDTTRRRAALSELSLPDEKQTRIMSTVADAFIAARLLTTNEVVGETTIEVSHEALIREWTRLSTWLSEARDDIKLQQAISTDVSDWVRRDKPKDRLYRGTRLTEAQVWAERNVPSSDEVAFFQASTTEHQRQEQEEQSRQARELSLKRQTVNRLRALVVVLTLLLIASIVFATVAQSLYTQALTQAKNASSRAFAAQANYALSKGQIDTALLLSVKANQAENTFDARDSLLSALEYSPHLVTMLRETISTVNQVMFLPDGQTLVSFGSTGIRGEVTFWNVNTRKSHTLHLDFHGILNPIPNWAFNSNGQVIAGANDDGLWLWDARSGTQITHLETANQGKDFSLFDVTPIAFSPDGTMIASSRCTQYAEHSQTSLNNHCTQGHILLWNLAVQPPVSQQLFSGPMIATHFAFSPDGKMLVVSSKQLLGAEQTAGNLQLWDVASGTVRASFTGFTGILWNFTLSPDGKTLAASNRTDSVYMWQVDSQAALGTPINAKGVHTLAFSPDGKTLATGNGDKTVQLWNVLSGLLSSTPLLGHTENITALAFSADGKTLASSDQNGTILLWNLGPDSSLKRQIDYTNEAVSVIFSPDGKTIITGNTQGQITLRDTATGSLLDTLDTASTSGTPVGIASLAFSPNKRILAAGRADGTIFLWDATTKQPIPPFHDETLLSSIVFNTDSHMLAASYGNGAILLWDTSTGHVLHRLSHPTANDNTASPIAFSPDGKILASGNNNTVIFWNVSTGKPIGQTPIGHQVIIKSVAFSPNGKIFASIDSKNEIMLSDADTMKPLLSQPLINTDPDILLPLQTGLTFSPDGTLLAAGSEQFVSVWNVATHERIAHTFRVRTTDAIFPYGYIRGIMFSPDGQQLLTLSDIYTTNFTVTLWNINQASWQTLACSIVNRNFTLNEWKQFFGGETYPKVCPNLPVDSTVTQDELAQAHANVLAGHGQDAQAVYAQATKEAAQLDNGDLANNVCWDGSTDQFASDVMSACNQAVALDQYYGQYYDSRGVARALTGNRQGAIDDFKSFVQWATEEYVNIPGASLVDQKWYKQRIAERNGWIQKLEAGKNPFDIPTLRALRIESSIDG